TGIFGGQTTPAGLSRKLIKLSQRFLITTSRTRDEMVVQMGTGSADLVAVAASDAILRIPSVPFRSQQLEPIRQKCLT
ncbi:hypothetical protein, partial [Burkholderia cenocepacia]|uniref:hypothetical protein n=1 Tax=Burkholderia cenocepacia TaxID=95486 RepID=UPI0019558266